MRIRKHYRSTRLFLGFILHDNLSGAAAPLHLSSPYIPLTITTDMTHFTQCTSVCVFVSLPVGFNQVWFVLGMKYEKCLCLNVNMSPCICVCVCVWIYSKSPSVHAGVSSWSITVGLFAVKSLAVKLCEERSSENQCGRTAPASSLSLPGKWACRV